MAWCEVCEYEPDNDSTVCTEETRIKASCPYKNKQREQMNKFYIGKCSKGLIVFKAIANTPLEQADCAKDIKNLIKKGFNVELVDADPSTPAPEWRYETRCGRCLR